MPQTNITDNEVMVITYGFVDFLQETDELRKQGFEFNFEDNKTYPQMIGHHFQCIMQKSTAPKKLIQPTILEPVMTEDTPQTETTEEAPQLTEQTPEVTAPKRGRPSGK